MTWFHGAQVALALVGLAVSVRQLRVLLFDNLVVPKPVLGAIEACVTAEPGRAERLAEAGKPAWVARAVASGLAERAGRAAPGALEELTFDLGEAASRGIRTLRTIGRASSPLAFIGVILELGLAFHGDRGIEGLQRGLVEQRAMQHAIVGLSIGIVTSVCALMAATTLWRHGRAQLRALQQVRALFESADLLPRGSAAAPVPLSRAET